MHSTRDRTSFAKPIHLGVTNTPVSSILSTNPLQPADLRCIIV
jgi:hypothetical protein